MLSKLQREEVNWVPRSDVMTAGSVADPDPGSGAFLTPGSGIGFFRIPDLRSRISDPGSQIPDSKSIFLRA